MKNLLNYIQSRQALAANDVALIERCFSVTEVAAHTQLLREGQVERYLYFLSAGIVKGYQNIEGKLVVQHLVNTHDFFTSLDSFMAQTPSDDYYESITDCTLVKIAKSDFDYLQRETNFWGGLVKTVTNEHLSCKLERVKDFQILSAKDRYLKFVDQYPQLALHVSVDNMASFLGMEPQSLSRIRKQITF